MSEIATKTLTLPFDNSYGRMPERFYTRMKPVAVRAPELIRLNKMLARDLDLDPAALETREGLAMFSGNDTPEGSDPIATVYAGHQFGGFSPQLGDGRAILIGEIVTKKGERYDIQLKGSGRTPYSRSGDGRAALGPILREYIVSEAMHALNVPTTRALAAVTTGEHVLREGPIPGAILTRVAKSHIRVGTFQYFTAQQDREAVVKLADHVINRHYPAARESETPYLSLLEHVIDAQAHLITKWMHLGFIHGVMNTDNMSIAGETIDYGPCAFMDRYDPATVYSYVDQMGRYAFKNQAIIGQWNLVRFAQCLLPLLDEDEDGAVRKAQTAIDAYPDLVEIYLTDGYRCKLGLKTDDADDLALAESLLELMRENEVDFTLFFSRLSNALDERADDEKHPNHLFKNPSAFEPWQKTWQERLQKEGTSSDDARALMQRTNPGVIPRNHQVEAAIRAAEDRGDFAPFHALVDVITRPFDPITPDREPYTLPPEKHEEVQQTFCGT